MLMQSQTFSLNTVFWIKKDINALYMTLHHKYVVYITGIYEDMSKFVSLLNKELLNKCAVLISIIFYKIMLIVFLMNLEGRDDHLVVLVMALYFQGDGTLEKSFEMTFKCG